MGKKKNKKNKTSSCGSSTEEDKEEVVKQTSVIEFICPLCQKMLEIKNEVEIQKKGNCKCSCVPIGFNIIMKDKKMSIDKSKDGDINLETDIHNITFKWGKQITPSDNGENETQEIIREMMKK